MSISLTLVVISNIPLLYLKMVGRLDLQMIMNYIIAEKNKKELKELYINKMNNILFTEEELMGPLKDYEDYEKKDYFIRNYLPLQYDYLTAWVITNNKEQVEEFNRKVKHYPYFSKTCYAYFKDKEAVDYIAKLSNLLEEKKNSKNGNYDYYYNAFIREMCNHEYAINWEADYDTLSAFGNLTYTNKDELNSYFEQLHFTDVQKNAYLAARNTVMKGSYDS